MRRILLISLAFVVVAVGAAALAGAYVWRALERPYAGFEGELLFDYAEGTPTRALARQLQDAGVIESEYWFLAARALRPGVTLQAGEYQFTEPASVWDVYRKLADGRVYLRPLTVPEGLTRFEVAALVAGAGYGTVDEVTALTADPTPVKDLFPQAKTLEGCLLPETYFFARSASAASVIGAMVDGFRKAFEKAGQGKSTPLDPYQVLIMASLVEKETGVPTERPLVSSVYHNRLRDHMLLQCDPTIIYGLVLEDRYKGVLYEPEIRDPHPYNTYVHAGLPPGPIANPGKASLEAAFHPAESSFLYFVAEKRGAPQHVFSKNLAAHNKAVAQYRKTRAQEARSR
ncbi:MAG: endolytic transglycosylase MltG [Acidobacteria bacterium]|nr:endolytic transglycosylase MltG [Acidobacteriota bacterium]